MYEAEVLQSLAILLLEVSPELCTVEKLQNFFETLFVGSPAANIKEIHINSIVTNEYSEDTKDNTSCSTQNVNKEEADGDEVAVVLFHTTEATRCVLERVEVVSSGSAYNLELRRGYLELNKQRVLVEGVLSVSANTSAAAAAAAASSSITTSTSSINATNALVSNVATPIITEVMNSNNSDNVTKASAESKRGNINNVSTLVDGEKDKNKEGSLLHRKDDCMKEKKLLANMKEEKLSKEETLISRAPLVYTEPIEHQSCALHNDNLSNALPVDPSHEFVNTNHSNHSATSNNAHPVLYFTFISIHSSECVITPFIIYQILCGVCAPLKILVLKNVPSTTNKYSISKNKKASNYHDEVERQHERQQRQHQRALVEVCTLDEAYDVIKYFDNIRVELMSSSVNEMQQHDSTTSNSTHDNADANVEMRFIIRVRLSTSRNESSSAFNSQEEYVTSGLQLRGNTMYSLELTNTSNESIGPAFDRQYEYRVEQQQQQQHKAILAQSHNANNSVQHADVFSYNHVNSNDNRSNEYENHSTNINNNDIAPHLTSEVSSVKISHTPQWSSHQSMSSRAHSYEVNHHSYVSYSSQSSTPSRSQSRSRSSSLSSTTTSSRSSSETNSYRHLHKIQKGHDNTSFDDIANHLQHHHHHHHQNKHHKADRNFPHEGKYTNILRNDNNNSIANDKSAHERKRQHTPSLTVMKYKKTRLHHGKDNNRHSGNLHNGENNNISSDNKKYNVDDISSPLGISHLPNSNNAAPLYSVTSTYPLHEPCETHVGNSNVSDVPFMNSNSESTSANYDNVALPPNWRVVFSDEYQQVYYVYRDPVSGQESTTWTRPT